jgi:hypothetical protein
VIGNYETDLETVLGSPPALRQWKRDWQLQTMAPLKPIYTPSNCRPAYQLNWSLSLFWKQPQSHADWLDALKPEVESDGIRLLQHRFLAPEISQFFVSTKPEVAPLELVRSVKGRLQHLIGERIPQAFRRNYGLRSIGAADRRAVENYIASQVQRHPMADPRVEGSLKAFQFTAPKPTFQRRGARHMRSIGITCTSFW